MQDEPLLVGWGANVPKRKVLKFGSEAKKRRTEFGVVGSLLLFFRVFISLLFWRLSFANQQRKKRA